MLSFPLEIFQLEAGEECERVEQNVHSERREQIRSVYYKLSVHPIHTERSDIGWLEANCEDKSGAF